MKICRRFAIALSLLLFHAPLPAVAQPAPARAGGVPVTDDLVIRRSTVLRPGVYTVNDAHADGILQIEADNITLDGTGVVIVGQGFRGYGIHMNGHSGLTLRNFTIRGFDYGVLIENASNALIEKNDISGNRKDITTGFFDIGCGACYGGGLLLRGVRSSIIRGNTLTNESTGLELIGCQDNVIYDNLLSQGPATNERRQDSAWGIRLEGSTGNLVRGNVADWVDRQRYGLDSGDSAGILLVAGSHDNRIISNSMTHSGDGFFLGNSCARESDRNYVYGNDGSFSPHNAFEATFSTGNVFDRNWANDSDYGFWLGYSHDSRVTRNEIARNASMGIAIEHGHGNEIDRNTVTDNPQGIRLWAADTTCPWPECGASCPSAGYRIHFDTLTGNDIGLAVEDTAGAAVAHNRLVDSGFRDVQVSGRSTGIDLTTNDLLCSGAASCVTAVANQMASGFDVNAAGNFWGTANPAELIFDHANDPGLGRVIYQPFLTAPIPAFGSALGCQDGEVVTALFRQGTRGAATHLSYQGLATIVVEGVGQASGQTFSDAFYLFAKGDGTPIPPVHPRSPVQRVLAIGNRPIDAWLADGKIPPYRPDHRYVLRIRAPRGPLTFGVAAPAAAGNSGQYTVALCGGTP